MSDREFDGPAWPPGEEWPAGVLPKPCLTLEIASLELEALIKCHDEAAAAAERDRTPETELFHKIRASYLRQRLGAVAPHRLTPDRAGRA